VALEENPGQLAQLAPQENLDQQDLQDNEVNLDLQDQGESLVQQGH